jgi:hypothetical protein
MHSPIYRFLPLSLLLSGCGSFDEPTAKDAAPIFGCYRSDEAPPLAISADGIRPYGFDKPVPFHYERRTVGMIVRAPFMADTGKDGLTFAPSEEHLYRLQFSDGNPILTIAFGPEGIESIPPPISRAMHLRQHWGRFRPPTVPDGRLQLMALATSWLREILASCAFSHS